MATYAGEKIRQNDVTFGKGDASDKTFIADKGSGATNPKLRYENSSSKWRFTNDGSTWYDIGTTVAENAWYHYFQDFAAPASTTELTQNTITINDYSGLSLDTWAFETPQGTVTLTEGTDFDAETNNDTTASNLKAVIITIPGYESSTVSIFTGISNALYDFFSYQETVF